MAIPSSSVSGQPGVTTVSPDLSTALTETATGSRGGEAVSVAKPETRLAADALVLSSGGLPAPRSDAAPARPDAALAAKALPSKTDLEGQLGKPKDHLFGGLWQRSTGYRDVLDKVAAHDKAVEGGNPKDILEALTALEHSLESYGAGNAKRTHKEAMGQLLRQVKSEIRDAQYQMAGIPKNDATRIGQLDDSHLTAHKALGSGAVNEVFAVAFRRSDSPERTGVFKPALAPGAFPDAASAAGIDRDSPNWASRNVASSKMDARLGTKLIGSVEFAQAKGKVGTVMDRASGKPLVHTDVASVPVSKAMAARIAADPMMGQLLANAHGYTSSKVEGGMLVLEKDSPDVPGGLKDPTLRKEMTKLQWLDILCGQLDRHGKNFFVSTGADGRAKVSAIDNDLAFGRLLTGGDSCSSGRITAGHGCALPGAIDRPTYDKLMAMTPADIDADLGGLLAADEVAATKGRLGDLQAHARGLADKGLVFDRDEQWAGAAADTALGLVGEDAAAAAALAKARIAEPGMTPKREAEVEQQARRAHVPERLSGGYVSRAEFGASAVPPSTPAVPTRKAVEATLKDLS